MKKKTSVLAKETATTAPKAYVEPDYTTVPAEEPVKYHSKEDLKTQIERTRKAMIAAAKKLEFLEAARLRDHIILLENQLSQPK